MLPGATGFSQHLEKQRSEPNSDFSFHGRINLPPQSGSSDLGVEVILWESK